jgi:hypothetical protein
MSSIVLSNKLLRRRLEVLERVVLKADRPWYQQASNIFSVLAVVISFLGVAFSQIHNDREDVRVKNEELRKVVVDMIELRQEAQRDLGLGGVGGQDLAAKQAALLSAAETLELQLKGAIPDSEYVNIAIEEVRVGRDEKAIQYYSRAVDLHESSGVTAVALIGLAQLRFRMGDAASTAAARELFDRAVAANTGANETNIVLRAQAYERWAKEENLRGDAILGAQKEEAARLLYKQLPPDNTQRQMYLDGLSNRVKQLSTSTLSSGSVGAPSIGAEAHPTNPIGLTLSDAEWILSQSGALVQPVRYLRAGSDRVEDAKRRDILDRYQSLGFIELAGKREIDAMSVRDRKSYALGYTVTEKFRDAYRFVEASLNSSLEMAR